MTYKAIGERPESETFPNYWNDVSKTFATLEEAKAWVKQNKAQNLAWRKKHGIVDSSKPFGYVEIHGTIEELAKRFPHATIDFCLIDKRKTLNGFLHMRAKYIDNVIEVKNF